MKMVDRSKNRSTIKYCKLCSKRISGAHWARHCKDVHNGEVPEHDVVKSQSSSLDKDSEEFKVPNPRQLEERKGSAFQAVVRPVPRYAHPEEDNLIPLTSKISESLAVLSDANQTEHEELKRLVEEQAKKMDEQTKKIENLEQAISICGKRVGPEQNMMDLEKLTASQRAKFVEFNQALHHDSSAYFLATQSVEESTRKTYFYTLKGYFREENDITIEKIKDFFGRQRKAKKYSIETLTTIKKVLKTICFGQLGWTSFPKIQLSSKKEKQTSYVPSKKEIDSFVELLRKNAKTTKWALIIRIMFVTALRPIDIQELETKHFHANKDQYYLEKTERKTRKTKKSIIPKELYDEVMTNTGKVFPFLDTKNYREQFKRFFDKYGRIGDNRMLPKSIRKASITHIFQTYGASVAMAQGGHSSKGTTVKHYVDPKIIAEALTTKRKNK